MKTDLVFGLSCSSAFIRGSFSSSQRLRVSVVNLNLIYCPGPFSQSSQKDDTVSAAGTHSPGSQFRALVQNEKPLQIVGTLNAYSALLAKQAGHKAIYLSGA